MVRAHWAIGNSLHRVLDVTMDEDQARNRNGAHCLAVMRRLALDIARRHPGKMPMRSKFLHASWSYDFLLDVIRAIRRRMWASPKAVALGGWPRHRPGRQTQQCGGSPLEVWIDGDVDHRSGAQGRRHDP